MCLVLHGIRAPLGRSIGMSNKCGRRVSRKVSSYPPLRSICPRPHVSCSSITCAIKVTLCVFGLCVLRRPTPTLLSRYRAGQLRGESRGIVLAGAGSMSGSRARTTVSSARGRRCDLRREVPPSYGRHVCVASIRTLAVFWLSQGVRRLAP